MDANLNVSDRTGQADYEPAPARIDASSPKELPILSEEVDGYFLLFIVSFVALICSAMRICFQMDSTGTPLILAAVWIPFFALNVGKSHAASTPKPAQPTSRGGTEAPFQFGLSDLLCGVFVVAMLMGIASMMRDQPYQGDSLIDLWNFLAGCVLTIAAALLVSSWRTRSKPGFTVGIPIFLGTLTHLLVGLPADDYILLVWSLLGLCLGAYRATARTTHTAALAVAHHDELTKTRPGVAR